MKSIRLTAAESAALGSVAVVMGLASAFAQFLGPRIRGPLWSIIVCAALTALTIGAVIVVKRVRSVSLGAAAATAVLAAAGGGGLGYLIRANAGPAGATVATTGRFENPPGESAGCLTGLRFTIGEDLSPGTDIWVMAYSLVDETHVYPERKMTFTARGATAAPFPIGSDADREGTEFEVLAVLVDAATTARYEKTPNLPVEQGVPGRIIDRFTVTRHGEYAGCP